MLSRDAGLERRGRPERCVYGTLPVYRLSNA
jgi:hypothetical protein